MDILMRLEGAGFAKIAEEFQLREGQDGKNCSGLGLFDFVEIVLQGLPKAHSLEELYKDVNDLIDLFETIDINGDAMLQFDEFSSFCVDSGMSATKASIPPLKYHYIPIPKCTIKTTDGCAGIERLKWSPQFQLFLVVEHAARTVKLFTLEGTYLAQVGGKSALNNPGNNLTTGLTNMSKELSIPLLRDGYKGSKNQMENFADEKRNMSKKSSRAIGYEKKSEVGGGGFTRGSSVQHDMIFVLDAVFMWKFKCLALSATDYVISFYNMNEPKQQTTRRVGPSLELFRRLTITTTTAQSMLRFAESTGLFFGSGNDFAINIWKITDTETKVLWKRIAKHEDMVMDIIDILPHELYVTCDLKGTIKLWDQFDFRYKDNLVGHNRGVKQLIYSTQQDMLLSVGYEFEALGWDLFNRQIVMKLTGHRAPLIGIQLAQYQTECAVTADMNGVIKVWDISRTIVSNTGSGGACTSSNSSKALKWSSTASSQSVSTLRNSRNRVVAQATQLESVDPIINNQVLTRFEPTNFICLGPSSRDLWLSNAKSSTLSLFRSVQGHQYNELPLKAFYHYSANKFVVISSGTCSIWDGVTGKCTNEMCNIGSNVVAIFGSNNMSDARPNRDLFKSTTSHQFNGGGGSHQKSVGILTCVPDKKCKKLVLTTENGIVGVLNALNLITMRVCSEIFAREDGDLKKNDSESTPSTSSIDCAVAGLHYCSENKLIILTDSSKQAIYIIDDNELPSPNRISNDTTNINRNSVLEVNKVDPQVQTSQKSIKQGKVPLALEGKILRKLTCIPGKILSSAYNFHTSLVATINLLNGEDVESDFEDMHDHTYLYNENKKVPTKKRTIICLWDFETLLLSGICKLEANITQKTPTEHALASTAPETSDCIPASYTDSFSNDHLDIPQMHLLEFWEDFPILLSADTYGYVYFFNVMPIDGAPKPGSCIYVLQNEINKENTSAESDETATAVTCMKVSPSSFDGTDYVLVTGDELGMVRVWDLSPLMKCRNLDKISREQLKSEKRGYNPKLEFSMNYLKELTKRRMKSQQHVVFEARSGSRRQSSRESSLNAKYRNFDHSYTNQNTPLSCTRVPTINTHKLQKNDIYNSQYSKNSIDTRAVMHATNGAAHSKGTLLLLRNQLRFINNLRSENLSRNVSSPVCHISSSWKAHSDCITSLEISCNPNIIITCSLDMTVFVFDWHGACIGKLFDSENHRNFQRWTFRKDDTRREMERRVLIESIISECKLSKEEKQRKRKQTLFESHVEKRKTQIEMGVMSERGSEILREHIVSQNTIIAHDQSISNCPTTTQKTVSCDENPHAARRIASLSQLEPISYRKNTTPSTTVSLTNLLPDGLASSHTTNTTKNGCSEEKSGEITPEFQITTAVSMQDQIAISRKVAEEEVVSNGLLSQKSEQMYKNFTAVGTKAITFAAEKRRLMLSDTALSQPSEFLKKHLSEAELAIVSRPSTAAPYPQRSNKSCLSPTKQLSNKRSLKRPTTGHRLGKQNTNMITLQCNDSVQPSIAISTRKPIRNALDHFFQDEVASHRALYTKFSQGCKSHEAFSQLESNESRPEVDEKILNDNQAFLDPMYKCSNVLGLAKLDNINYIISQVEKVKDAPLISSSILPKVEENMNDVRRNFLRTTDRMDVAMADNEIPQSKLNALKNLQKDQQLVAKLKRDKIKDEYFQQKRRDMNVNLANAFKRTSFAYHSNKRDNVQSKRLLASSKNKAKKHAQYTNNSKSRATLKTKFGIYSVADVMSVIRLFWMMDEDMSGFVSLHELLQYQQYFEAIGYHDMTTIFQSVDKDGNGHVSLSELLELCFEYASRLEIDEMLKLAKIGNIQSYLVATHRKNGKLTLTASSNNNVQSTTSFQNLPNDIQSELTEIFKVFDKNSDGSVSIQELMEVLGVDDDDELMKIKTDPEAQTMQNIGHHSPCNTLASKAITKSDIMTIFQEYDTDGNGELNFSEFVELLQRIHK